MLKRLLVFTTLSLLVTLTAVASDREDDVHRTHKAAEVFQEIMNAPDQGIPTDLLESAKCIAIIPGDVKFAFIFGASYGRGLATCRTGHGWSAPAFIRIAGGSFGFQIGGQATDLVLVAVNDKGFQDLLKNKFKIGGDASAAAGPVGRDSQAATDWKLNAELLTYSRAKGLFAGVDLTGAVVDENVDATRTFYGVSYPSAQILKGQVAVPPDARPFVRTVAKYFTDSQK